MPSHKQTLAREVFLLLDEHNAKLGRRPAGKRIAAWNEMREVFQDAANRCEAEARKMLKDLADMVKQQ